MTLQLRLVVRKAMLKVMKCFSTGPSSGDEILSSFSTSVSKHDVDSQFLWALSPFSHFAGSIW
jgi:hypothetical protein